MPCTPGSPWTHPLQHSRNSDYGNQEAAGRREERDTGTLITAARPIAAASAAGGHVTVRGCVGVGGRVAGAGDAAAAAAAAATTAAAATGAALGLEEVRVGEILVGAVLGVAARWGLV